MKLAKLYQYVSPWVSSPITELPDINLQNLHEHHAAVQSGDVFLAAGQGQESKDYIAKAITLGAGLVISSQPYAADATVPVWVMPQLREKIPAIAKFFYGDPAAEVKIIGITGTNGKTSIAYMLAQILCAANNTCAQFGTLGVGLPHALHDLGYTTPPATVLYRELAKLKNQGIKACAMEVSSHGIAQQRIAGIEFALGIYTNLSPEHLDFHRDMATYWQVKASFFMNYKFAARLFNADCPFGRSLLAQYNDAIAYSLEYRSEFATRLVYPKNLQQLPDGVTFQLYSPWGSHRIAASMVGKHNISNLIAVCAAALWYSEGNIDLSKALANCKLPPGRMQMLTKKNKPLVVVDYAHTPDALAKCLSSIHALYPGKVCCVFGCGGNRDRAKRPVMLDVAAKYSKRIILTADNPRHEKVADIIKDMQAGRSMTSCEVIPDRATAIQYAITSAVADEVIVIAGRGHEQFQLVAGNRLPLVDSEVAQQALEG